MWYVVLVSAFFAWRACRAVWLNPHVHDALVRYATHDELPIIAMSAQEWLDANPE